MSEEPRVAARSASAVRVAGAGVIGWFGQLTIDMPSGYFGAVDRITTFGLVYGVGALLLGGLCAAGEWRRASWSKLLASALVVLNVGFFALGFADDPIVAISVITWQLFVLSRLLFPAQDGGLAVAQRRGSIEDDRTRHWLERWRPALVQGLLLSTACSVGVVGFRLTDLAIGLLSCLVLVTVTLGSAVPLLWSIARSVPRLRWVLAVALLVLVLVSPDPEWLVATAAVYQGILLAYLVLVGPLFAEVLSQLFARPALLLVSGFGSLSALGAIALSFPAASVEGVQVGFLDAVFTATSAVCVTGLIVLDTPVDFTAFGQVVILVLIQLGGLGIMVVSTFATIALGGRLGLRGEHALEQVLDLSTPGRAYRLARFIVLATLSVEAVGALLLTLGYRLHDFDWGEALWRGVFHSISAFCNAGFALQSDSLVMFQEDPEVLVVFSLLVIAGGVGFVVLAWTWRRVTFRGRERASVQIRIVVAVSVILLLAGFIEICIVEWERSLSGLSPGSKVANAWFQSVTTRTAGFNSVDLQDLHPATVLSFIALMFVGAAPGGTAGGIKVTTLAVLIAAIPAIARGQVRATLFRREIDAATILRASTIAVLAALVLFLSSFVLLATEVRPFFELVFEAASALGTVGLSLGATPELGAVGKGAMIVTMFIGRLGPLSVALLLARSSERAYRYPSTRIMVG